MVTYKNNNQVASHYLKISTLSNFCDYVYILICFLNDYYNILYIFDLIFKNRIFPDNLNTQ